MFVFDDKNSAFDQRVIFANAVCKLLVEKNEGDIDKSLDEIKPIYDGFDENVRNIYQFIDKQIPLFALYDLKRLGADNWDLSPYLYAAAIGRAKDACKSYYCS